MLQVLPLSPVGAAGAADVRPRWHRLPLQATIAKMLPGDVVLPRHRLEHLLRQSLRYQELQALYPYTKSTRLNLAEDLAFDATRLPSLCTELEFHSDEVWVCKFSPSGRWLATAGNTR